MLIISTFEHSIELEEALAVLEEMGLSRQEIMTVMMDNHRETSDHNYNSNPNKKTLAFEVGMATSTGATVLGISFGFILYWGPIIWGVISAICGFLLGFIITRVIQAKVLKHTIRKKERLPELAIIIQCHEGRLQEVQHVLWEYQALSVGKIYS
ncbi:hypothetical protein [Paenibacillus qinlingensis]|uniref:Uncharacterized protein YneF (UPF0154 family) n=1 Tax=Paenibacillus qinlingensis TaxID=1837343 RepID=A0ABU1NQZ7_9BACL|nr:hypothetical protein [Paenibacillus qinlingensis]MDR6549875.1 uncharacterized protein YneF (UPF0154 family) [Paenibacillus qinlingensis]